MHRLRFRARRGAALVLTAVVGAAAAGCGGGGADADDTPFTYDRSQALATRDGGIVDRAGGLVLRDLSFATPSGRTEALLVAPRNAADLPAVVYVHGAGADRTSMLGPASWLAARGAVALSITQPSATTPVEGSDAAARLRAFRDVEVADVVAVRRAIDVLENREEVDPERIGYVGWSAGARTGALLAGVEPRLKALVLISGGSQPVDAFVAAAPSELQADVEQTMSEIDPLRWIGQAQPERLLLQDGEEDEITPRTALEALADAAPEGTDVRWYPGGHAPGTQAFRDQLDWLQERLDITGPAVPGVPTGP